MVDKMAFLKAYNIDEDDFKAADISWEELAAIYDDYLSKEEKLREIGKDFVNDYLYDIERAESIPTDTVPKIRDIFWRRSYENGKKIRRNSKILTGIIIINT